MPSGTLNSRIRNSAISGALSASHGLAFPYFVCVLSTSDPIRKSENRSKTRLTSIIVDTVATPIPTESVKYAEIKLPTIVVIIFPPPDAME